MMIALRIKITFVASDTCSVVSGVLAGEPPLATGFAVLLEQPLTVGTRRGPGATRALSKRYGERSQWTM